MLDFQATRCWLIFVIRLNLISDHFFSSKHVVIRRQDDIFENFKNVICFSCPNTYIFREFKENRVVRIENKTTAGTLELI